MEKKVLEECINPSVCKECGGKCCIKSGCDFYPRDFNVINKESIINVLESGKASITSISKFSILNSRKICEPFLYLRARNVDRGIVDLLSLKKRCSMLTETGCSFSPEDRPSGGLNLIPSEVKPCRTKTNPLEEIKAWANYQNLLAKLVKRYTHRSLDEEFRYEVEQFLYSLYIQDFDGVSERELKEVVDGLGDLIDCFPEEKERARVRANVPINVLNKIGK